MRRIRIIGTIAIAASITAGVFSQPQSPPRRPLQRGTSTLRGRVLDSVTKAPVAGCTVRAAASGFYDTRVSDEEGAYEFTDIAAGNYFFMVQCAGHLRSMCSEPNEPLNLCPVELIRDQQRDDVNFRVIPGATARGQVLAFDGRPLAGANVRLGRGIHGESTPLNVPATTDANGRFELTNLQGGEWRVEVEIPPAPGGLRPPVIYYPGLLSWEEAVGIELVTGKVTEGITITVPRINENTLIVSVPPADATISEVAVSVLQQTPLVTRRLAIDNEGIGTLKGVLPGRYFALALASSGDKRWAGFEVIDFFEDTYEARLQLLPTGSIAGKVVIERGAPSGFDGVIVGASWVYEGAEVNPLEFAEAKVAADGSFRIDGLFGTRKLQLRALGTEWEVAAVRQERTDVTESGLVVVPDATIDATIVVRKRPAFAEASARQACMMDISDGVTTPHRLPGLRLHHACAQPQPAAVPERDRLRLRQPRQSQGGRVLR